MKVGLKKIVATDQAPAAIGPYSQAIQVGEFLFTSGQLPVDPASGEIIAGGVKEQTDMALANLQAVLAAAGVSLADVIKTTLYIKNMSDFGIINETYGKYFNSNPPARSCVEVARLPKDVLVEVEAIAIVEK
jgi:2-iminobutanoate/2-iminopropanoate deaminase